jgi:ribosome-binding factor A
LSELCTMVSRRQEKFSRLIQKELGYIFLTIGKKHFGNAMISVTRVVASPDFGYVKVYLNFLNVKDPEQMMELVHRHTKDIRWALGNQLKNSVRKIPELSFFYDDTLDYVEKMEDVFKQLHEKDAAGNTAEDDGKDLD